MRRCRRYKCCRPGASVTHADVPDKVWHHPAPLPPPPPKATGDPAQSLASLPAKIDCPPAQCGGLLALSVRQRCFGCGRQKAGRRWPGRPQLALSVDIPARCGIWESHNACKLSDCARFVTTANTAPRNIYEQAEYGEAMTVRTRCTPSERHRLGAAASAAPVCIRPADACSALRAL